MIVVRIRRVISSDMENNPAPAKTVDCRGLLCPEPVVRVRQALDGLMPGEEIEVVATDPLAELDLQVFCERSGHQFVGAVTRNGETRARIRVRPAP